MQAVTISALCPRCSNKQKIAKTWTETIQTFNGTAKVLHQKIVCTNVECQVAFEENIVKENKKKEQMKKLKEENELKRKAAMTKKRK